MLKRIYKLADKNLLFGCVRDNNDNFNGKLSQIQDFPFIKACTGIQFEFNISINKMPKLKFTT